MHIQSFHIDAFGKLSDVGIEDLPRGLVIFLGNNEAGKSTCLEFFRTMLTGYTSYVKDIYKPMHTVDNKSGGSIDLHTANYDLVRLTRRPGKGQGLMWLADRHGEALETSLLDKILAGVTRDVYRNVFGFSLNELQVLESLSSEEVRHALYGASFGMHLRSPSTVLKELTAQMEKRFKSRGTTPLLNISLKEWEEVQKHLRHVQNECTQFDNLSMQKQDLEGKLSIIREQKGMFEQQRRQAERQLGVWKQWDEWRTTEQRLARLEPVAASFPAEGPSRLEKAQHMAMEATRRIQTQEERCKKIEESMVNLPIHEALLDKRPSLQALSEHKTSFRHAQSSLGPVSAQIARHDLLLQERLADLGPEWTCARIRSMNRSLFIRSELEKCASHIQATEGAHTAAASALEKVNINAEEAKHAVEIARTTYASIPVPTALLNIEEREDIRRSLALIENAQNTLQEKENALRQALQTLRRTLNPLHIRHQDNDFEPGEKNVLLQKLEGLIQSREQGLRLAKEAQEARKETQNSERIVLLAQEEEDNLRSRLDRTRKSKDETADASRKNVDMRTNAVRNLRHLGSSLTLEEERLHEMSTRHAEAVAPEPVKSILLMIIGILVMLAGIAGLLMPLYFGIHEIQITKRLILPLTQFTSYFVVVAGAAFLAGGMPRSGPENERFKREQKSLEERISTQKNRIMDLEGRIQEQCVLAEVPEANPSSLDAVELALEEERQKCSTDERLSVELLDLEKEYADITSKTQIKKHIFNQLQNAEQQTLQKWHNLLRAHDIDTVPSPDAAEAFFARVEAAIVAQEALQSLLLEATQLEHQIQERIRKLASYDPIHDGLIKQQEDNVELEILNNDPKDSAALAAQTDSTEHTEENASEKVNAEVHNPEEQDAIATTNEENWTILQVITITQRVLDACRLADEAEAERLKAQTALDNAGYSEDMALKAQAEAMATLQQCERTLAEARESWKNHLQELGIGMDVEPSMLRAALECMENCLNIESEIIKLKEEYQRLEKECQALILPLQSILEELQWELPVKSAEMEEFTEQADIPYQEDWVGTLDNVLFNAQAARENKQAYEQYVSQLTTYEEELHEAQRQLQDANVIQAELLRLAEAPDSEKFLQLATVLKQKEELMQRKADLEDALRLAAGVQDFEEFLTSFTETDEQEREIFIKEMEKNLQGCTLEEEENITTLADINATLRTLSTSDQLAKLRQKERNLQETIHNGAKDWARYALARQLILQAKHNFELERQPHVIRMASEIFQKITAGRWKNISASLEESSLYVLPPHGEPVSPVILSRGTQEQLYLSLRLAYIRDHAEHAAALPIIMDDILVNFDPQRAERTAHALLHLCENPHAHQVLFFTCHPHIADMLQEKSSQSQRYIVEDGNIIKA